MNNEITINKRKIGIVHPAYIIAEMSANHNQDFDTAVEMVEAAKAAGADAIKLQTYTADTMTIDCDNDYFQIKQGTIWDGKTLYELYKEAYTPWDWQPKLKNIAEKIGLDCFSSPFDMTAVDFLESMDVPAYKIASFEITDIPLIEYVASKKKPVIISTGIATLEEIEEAISACHRASNNDIALLKCTSSYPSKLEDANVRMVKDMRERFNLLTGISDHSMSNIPCLAAIALGGCIIEKHFILDRKQNSPDAPFSLEPSEFRKLVDDIRALETSLGSVSYELSDNTINNRKFSRSLFATEDIKAGELFTENNIRSIRPAGGLLPKHIGDFLGKTATNDIKRGTPLSEDLLEVTK